MLFNKPLNEVNFQDIRKLLDDEIDESEILDYKERDIEDDKVLKEVAAFSNTRGGFLLYGVKENGRGGHPVSIDGIEKGYNAERLEQIIISNIMPRINVQIKKIDIPDSDKMILIIQIPEGQNQPYYSNRTNKFYKRYNFEAKEMSEHEIEALYQERFFGFGKLAMYVDETVSFNRSLMPPNTKPLMDAHIIITPLRISEKMIDISFLQKLKLDPNNVNFEPRKSEPYLPGFPSPSKYGIRWRGAYNNQSVEMHRNGFIHYMNEHGYLHEEKKLKIGRASCRERV